MTQGEFEDYWIPARTALIKGTGRNELEGSIQLAELVEVPYLALGYWDRIPMTPELKWKLQLLAGPHRHTVIKMMEVRRE